MSQSSPSPLSPEPKDPHAAALSLVQRALERLKFGAVHLTVHEGRLVQIEVTEKTRLTA